MQIDLNADMGEGFGAYQAGCDDGLLKIVTSANVACGFHAGDPTIMHRLAVSAKKRRVGLGAHPGYNDLWGFGRRDVVMGVQDLEYLVAYQIGAMQAFASYSGTPLEHVKAHGALYNLAAKDDACANAFAKAVKAVDPDLVVVGLPASRLQKAVEKRGLAFAREGFCDRVYGCNGSLMPRSVEGSVIRDPAAAAAQAVRLAANGEAVAADGTVLRLPVDTLCVHGDAPDALSIARAVRDALAKAGVRLARMRQILPCMGEGVAASRTGTGG